MQKKNWQKKNWQKKIDDKAKTVFSGIQPTGNIHLGNYLGAIVNWIELQKNHNCLFGIMNLHAITNKQNPKQLQDNVSLTLATYLACGLDPALSKIFIQSEISEHAELAWIFSTITSLGWLNRMTQFKDKVGSFSGAEDINLVINNELESDFDSIGDGKKANLGLYSYPVLMASDILLYKTDLVPVGEDQKQHLELCRDIAKSFNYRYKIDYFKLPEPLIIKQTKRIMSLQDGNKKMSKSDSSDLSRINLFDSADEISKKIKKSKTDSLAFIDYNENRPEIYNLLNIFAGFSEKDPQEIAMQYQNSGYGKFKQDLADLVISNIIPISREISQLLNNKDYLQKILNEGKLYAKEIAFKTKEDIYKITGLN
jgi:tryptophanyl-tRNA synthetase